MYCIVFYFNLFPRNEYFKTQKQPGFAMICDDEILEDEFVMDANDCVVIL